MKASSICLAIVAGVISSGACEAIENVLPRSFQGLWVTDETHSACREIRVASDARHAGEGALFLDGKRYYSQETDCNVIVTAKSCCNSENEDTRSGTLICGKYKYPIIFHLQTANRNDQLIVAEYSAGVNGPTLKSYKRCAR
jgi:hypothetical protein